MRPRKLATLAALVALLGLAAPASAQTSGTVTVSGTNTAKMTISIGDTSAAYGTSLGPDGSGTGGEISSVTGSSGNQGAYYIWTPATVPNVTVRSNTVWNGTVSATETTGTSTSMTIASGVLRRCTAVPASYTAAAACTAFTTTASNWASNVASGISTYTHYFTLRVDWNDTTGTFASTVTYAVAP